MNNKKLLYLFLLVSLNCFSQVSYTSWVNSYLQINSYSGNTNPEAYTFTLSGNGPFNVPYWKISMRLKQPITSTDGKYTIPANKISFQPVSSSGQAYPGPVPTIPQIGMPLNTFLQEQQEVFLIPQSNAPLYNQPIQPNGYYNLQLKYSMNVMGGSYLGNYPSWINFIAPIQFTAYDQYNNIIGRTDHNFQFQIGTLSGTPTDVPEMSLQFSAKAVNGSLEFKSMSDYVNGVSATYTNALIVKSNTNYQIKLRSLQGQFTSPAGNFIPLATVKLDLTPVSGNKGNVYSVLLSASPQLIATGGSTGNSSVYYDIKYSTKANDERVINAKSEEYSTTLQYEIIPQ
ncbi:hypothetical protein F3J23_13610 [Chryseobacterium sp. Tr-659]|uniref:hypothetical protein n=1 Tax=Chryseobacterium sp. Tr-659 TaxID=2608340 RepID=UPI001420F29D|nr:hypothetical protein [Chryseobacterium sp. Tr-659]NIF06480.1 hypothetical protein [Chryseobacterium sp. Tr-659]